MSSQDNNTTDYDVIIVGGAAAGLTAALYASRRAMRALVITKALGGQAAMAPSVENYPGLEPMSGIDIMLKIQEQAEAAGAEVVFETVTDIKQVGENFEVTSTNLTKTTQTVILAFGLTPKSLDVPGEEALTGKGVTYCATCDGPLFKGKKVAIVGGTHEALDAAQYMTEIDAEVTLIHKKDNYPQFKDLFAAVQENLNVTLKLNHEVTKITGEQKVESVTIRPVEIEANPKKDIEGQAAGPEEELVVDGVFVENGHKIDSEWLGDLVEYGRGKTVVVTDDKETKTPGLFAAGDLTEQRDKQIIVSAGAGATAALSAYKYIQKKIGKPAVLVDWEHKKD